jgi:hypothetical protein
MIRKQSFQPSFEDKENRKALEGIPHVEACSDRTEDVISDVVMHPFFAAVHKAFDKHYPLVISPDMIWLLISQGIGTHVSIAPEECREKFVKHEGKLQVKIDRDEFVMGSESNDWVGVFSEFSKEIRKHIGPRNMDMFVRNFSTTGPAEKAAFEIGLMDALKAYFDWRVSTMCGIPKITLEGNPSDWSQIFEATANLRELGLDWWTEKLDPILEQFYLASDGRPDEEFWRDMYKLDDGSGGPYITGWATNLLPYIKHGEKKTLRNWMVVPDGDRHVGTVLGGDTSITTANLTSGLSRCPFIWEYYDKDFDYELISGFVGVTQDEYDFSLRPKIGWAVRPISGKGRKPEGRKER